MNRTGGDTPARIDEANINWSGIEAEYPDSATFSYTSTWFTSLSLELFRRTFSKILAAP